MLKILVCVKQVPDVDLVTMDPETGIARSITATGSIWEISEKSIFLRFASIRIPS